MHKKLEAELVSLAHSILQMKNKDDVNALHKEAHDVYEKLSLLKFVDSYFKTTPNSPESKEEIIFKIEEILANEVKEEPPKPIEIIDEEVEKKIPAEEKVEEIFEQEKTMIKDDAKEIPPLQTSLEEEFKDAISADIATNLFEKATKENPVIEQQTESKKQSLNEALFKNNLQIGLNDRIAFVKHLFDGSQKDFNRVVSQLNSFKTEKEAKSFINKLVKPDYDWSNNEEYEQRLLGLIERHFL